MRGGGDEGTLRVVHVTGGVPVQAVSHAGGVLQRDVTASLLAHGHDVLVLAPAHRGNRRDLPDSIASRTVLPEDLPARRGLVGLAVRAAHRLNAWAYGAVVQRSHPPFVVALLLDPRVRRTLRRADVIDLQWFAQIRLYPLVRILAGRRPVVVGTFHDVVSQRALRTAEASTDPGERARALRAAHRARRAERLLGRRLDRSVVLSEKDRGLLVDAGVPTERISVLAPRFAAPELGAGRHPDPATVLFVGYLARAENEDAVRWMLEEIWPAVRAARPYARLRIVGGGVSEGLRSAAQAAPGVEVTGFVEDLWSEYAAATCCVVPLREGAGVKFKTIEALLAGVPTVATPIGAEGVGTTSDFVEISEEAPRLASGVLRALRDPAAADAAVRTARRLAALHHPDTFDATVRRVYATAGRAGQAGRVGQPGRAAWTGRGKPPR